MALITRLSHASPLRCPLSPLLPPRPLGLVIDGNRGESGLFIWLVPPIVGGGGGGEGEEGDEEEARVFDATDAFVARERFRCASCRLLTVRRLAGEQVSARGPDLGPVRNRFGFADFSVVEGSPRCN